MNILFFLTAKEKVAHVDESNSVRQVLEKMKYYGYTAVPLLDKEGHYLGTVTEGDLLWALWQGNNFNFVCSTYKRELHKVCKAV